MPKGKSGQVLTKKARKKREKAEIHAEITLAKRLVKVGMNWKNYTR